MVSVAVAQQPTLDRIEEDWELVVGDPDPEIDAPQVTTSMIPFSATPDLHLQVNLNRPTPKRGAALILAVVLMFVLFSMLAFTIDTGYLSQTRAELTRCSDSAALAGCWDLYRQLENNVESDVDSMRTGIVTRASEFASLNNVCEDGPDLVSSDIKIGFTNQLRGGQYQVTRACRFMRCE